jgi:hypothetical protein
MKLMIYNYPEKENIKPKPTTAHIEGIPGYCLAAIPEDPKPFFLKINK